MEPKLLTEAEWRKLIHDAKDPDRYALWCALRERGLIAAEPVDPLLVEAREIVQEHYPEMKATYNGRRIQIALAALRRGIEIGAERLTREMVWEAMDKAFDMSTWPAGYTEAMYDALVKQMKGEV